MKLLVGLGNIGEKYAGTRHNAGFLAIDKISSELKSNKNFLFQKPGTMMNASGVAVKKLVDTSSLAPDDLYIIHDDLDLKLGDYKIQKGKGPKIHNGVASVEKELGTTDFWRVRIGIDNRSPNNRTPGELYVLQDFTYLERKVIDSILAKIANEFSRLSFVSS